MVERSSTPYAHVSVGMSPDVKNMVDMGVFSRIDIDFDALHHTLGYLGEPPANTVPLAIGILAVHRDGQPPASSFLPETNPPFRSSVVTTAKMLIDESSNTVRAFLPHTEEHINRLLVHELRHAVDRIDERLFAEQKRQYANLKPNQTYSDTIFEKRAVETVQDLESRSAIPRVIRYLKD